MSKRISLAKTIFFCIIVCIGFFSWASLTVLFHVEKSEATEKINLYKLCYRYNNGTIEFKFNINGGKPPYKYGYLSFNNISINDMLNSYKAVRGARTYGYGRGQLFYISPLQVEAGLGYFSIGNEAPYEGFCWPPDISFPINMTLTIIDSSNPPQSGTLRLGIGNDGKKCAPYIFFGLEEVFIEKNGNRL